MAKVTITIEDTGEKEVSFLTEIEGVETHRQEATPAMLMGMSSRALFESGVLARAAEFALAALADGRTPADGVMDMFPEAP